MIRKKTLPAQLELWVARDQIKMGKGTHMFHKVESAVDLGSGALLSVEVQPATKGDATGMAGHFETVAAMVE